MIFYMTSAMVSDKTILQIDADSLLFFNVFIFNRQIFLCDFRLSWKILKFWKICQCVQGNDRGPEAPEAPAFSNWKIWYAFISVYPTWFIRLND